MGLAFASRLERLIVDTEAALGASVDFPNVGAAYGIDVGGRLITSDSPDQMYVAARVVTRLGCTSRTASLRSEWLRSGADMAARRTGLCR